MALRTISAGNKQNIAFFKIGGTWDMVKVDGKLVGSGGLDDSALATLERQFAELDSPTAEKHLVEAVESSVQSAAEQPSTLAEHLSWVPHIDRYATGQFYSLFSGDSSHLRASLIAPLVNFLLQYANQHPDIQVVGAQGTDTADLAILPLLDAFLFDTNLPPVLLTGANRSQHEWNSDAPKNFSDLFQLAGAHLPAGGYWVFGSHIYRASDMLKIDPTESRRIENFTTFFAPRLTSRYTKKVIGENALFQSDIAESVDASHPIHQLETRTLFDAMNAIDVVDLGNLNPVQDDVKTILDPSKKAVVIAAYALGNASNPIKQAAVVAAKAGKIVLVVDKSLLGVVNVRYEAGLIGANSTELKDTSYRILSGHRLGKASARALVTRALLQGYDQQQAQELVIQYCESRQLLE